MKPESAKLSYVHLFFSKEKRGPTWPPSNLVCDFLSKIIFRISESFQGSLFYILVIWLLFYFLMIEITALFRVCFILRLYCKFIDTYNTSFKTTFCPKCIPVFAVPLHSYLCLTFFLTKIYGANIIRWTTKMVLSQRVKRHSFDSASLS